MQLLTIFVVVLFLGVACGQEVLIEGFVAQCLGEHSSTDTSVKTAGSSGFSLLRVDYRTKSSGDIEVYGRIRNDNTRALTVKVEVMLRDANGHLIDSAFFWVSTSNIMAGSTMGFSWLFDPYKNLSSVDVSIIDIHEW